MNPILRALISVEWQERGAIENGEVRLAQSLGKQADRLRKACREACPRELEDYDNGKAVA